ncbi:MAG: di-heme oxidoredictase family protein [Sedimenticola sp.]
MQQRQIRRSTKALLLSALIGVGAAAASVSPSQTAPTASATYAGKLDKHAFSHPSANMDREREMDFRVGKGFFKRLWVTPPSSTQAADGLGPLFNARACMSCHPRNGRGKPPESITEDAISMFLRVDIPPRNEEEKKLLAEHRLNNIPDPFYGLQLQHFAVAGHNAEYRLLIDYEEIPVQLAGGETVHLRKPRYTAANLGYGPFHPEARFSPRVAQQMIGLGLLEAVDEAAILALADPEDIDGDGISGRPNRVWSREHGKVMLGRFGHKAGMPNVNEQSQAAFINDIGISVPLFPKGSGECTNLQIQCLEAPTGNSPQYDDLEAPPKVAELVTFYASNLAVPRQRNRDDPDVQAGETLFRKIGCSGCHTQEFVTKDKGVAREQNNQIIRPYTDLLLHDMGEGLADHRPEGAANGREWRTAPLWGIGLTPLVSGHSTYLHDGRARSLLEAILWHGGEAQSQRDAVTALSQHEREQFLKFIESI